MERRKTERDKVDTVPSDTTPSKRSRIFLPVNRSVRALIVYSLFQGLYLGYISIFWQPFVISLGLSIASIGIMEALSGQYGILSSLIQSIGGRLSDFGRKRVILLGSLILTCCWAVSTIAFAFRVPALIYFAYVLWALGSISLPAIDAILADTVRPKDRPQTYSLVLMASLLPSSVTGYLAGQYSQNLGASVFIGLAALFEGTGLAILYFILKDGTGTLDQAIVKGAEQRGSGQTKRINNVSRTVSNIRLHWRYFSVMSLDTLTWGIGTSLLYGFLTEAQDYTNHDFGLIALILPIGVVVGTIPGGSLSHRIGPRRLLIISECLGAAMLLGWAFYPLPEAIPVYAFSWGFAISTWVPVQFHLSSSLFPQKNRGELMGNLGTVRGLIRGAGPIVALLLFLEFGYRGPAVGGAIGIFLTIVLIAKFIPARLEI